MNLPPNAFKRKENVCPNTAHQTAATSDFPDVAIVQIF
jgi:hypothetical protein